MINLIFSIMKKTTVYLFVFFICNHVNIFAQSNAKDYSKKAAEYIEKQEIITAMKILSEGLEKFPTNALLYNMRGAILESQSFFKEAIEEFTAAIKYEKDEKVQAFYYANRGGTKIRLRDFESAYSDLILAYSMDSLNLGVLNNLAVVCDEIGKGEDTFKYLEKILEVDPNNMGAYINLGFKYQQENQHKKAIKCFDKALELLPNQPLGFSNRSFSKLKINDIEGAMKDINRSIDLMPSNSYAYKIRALILIEQGKIKKACENLEKANILGYTKQYGKEVNELLEKYCK